MRSTSYAPSPDFPDRYASMPCSVKTDLAICIAVRVVKYPPYKVSGIQVQDATPAIVDNRTFGTARKMLDDPERRRRGKRKYHYALSGRVQCLKCGKAMVGQGRVNLGLSHNIAVKHDIDLANVEGHVLPLGQCGFPTLLVPFRPRGDRPVYCSDCFSSMRR